MVYIKKWSEFQNQSIELLSRSPEKTRYLIKATPSQQWLILKVTDDHVCLKFRARSAIIINRFEAFTRAMTAAMAGLPQDVAGKPLPTMAGAAMDVDTTPSGAAKGVSQGSGAQTTNAHQQSNVGVGMGKKKKKKGKK